MKHLFLKFTKKTFGILLLGISLLLLSQEMMAQKTSVQSGPWTDTATWGGAAVPNTTESVTIASGHNVTFAPTASATIGSLSIASNASLIITGTFSRTIGNLSVAATGLFDSTTGATSLAASSTWVNNGTIILTTLGLGTGSSRTVNNNGSFTSAMGSGSEGVFNNNFGATFTLTGTVAGNINNFGTMNSAGLSGTAAVANITNKSSGIFNFTASSMNATNLVLNASEAGNTVNYTNSSATTIVRDINYSNLNISGSTGTKFWAQSADRTVSGNLTIDIGVTLRVTTPGSVSSVTIPTANRGSGYTVAPTATFSAAPTGGTTATGTAVLTAGVVTSVTITNAGAGYASAPTVTFSGGTTTGTAATNGTTALTALPTTYKFTATGTTTNNGTLNFDSLAGTGDKTFTTFNNPGAITSAASASFIFTTADYSAVGAQTVLAGTYTNLTLSGSGLKTIPTVASGILCTGRMTISGAGGSSGVRASVTNANVKVNILFLGSTGQSAGTIGISTNTTYFNTGTGSLDVQQTYAITSTAVGGDWSSNSTWVDGIVPANSSADYVVIVGGATVNLTLLSDFQVGALTINSGGTLNVTGNFGFTIASRSPFSNIAGSLNITGTASRTIGNLIVASTGSIISTGGATSLGVQTTPWVNNGTITFTTLGLPLSRTIENNGTFSCAMGTTSAGIFNNNSGATFTLNGNIGGNINNFGIMNSSSLGGAAAIANITNKASGVLNFTGGSMAASNLALNATEAGNTVNYSGTTQTVKDLAYSNLILSSSGTKTWPQSADRTVSGNLTINSGVTLRVSSASVSSISITNGGSGYGTTAPTVTFTAPAAGATAAGTAVLTGGVVTSVIITNPGSGYSSAPTVTFAAPTSGTTAAGTATLAVQPTTYKFTVTGTTTNNGTLNFDSFAGTGDKTFAIFNNPGTITSTAASNYLFTTADYSGAAQTIIAGIYSNLTLSGSGTKTIGTAASGTLCTGKMTIASGVKANVTNANVAVNKLILGSAGQTPGTIGFTGSGATTIDTAYFVTGLGTLNVQQTYSIISTAVGGDWNLASTWVDGVVPANSSADYVTIVGTATVNLTLTAGFTVGALDINQGGTLNVSSSSNVNTNTFTLGTRSPGSTIAGALLFNNTVYGGKSFGNVTVTATGSVIESRLVSVSVTSNTAVTNYGIITTNTLAPTASTTNFYNYGTLNIGGFSSQTQGTFTNYSSGTLNMGGTIAGNFKNYGTVNATSMTPGAAFANNFYNYSTGVLNYTGSSITSTTLVLDTSEAGNTVNYSRTTTSQTVKDIVYSNLILSGSGTKTIATAASSSLSTGILTISESAIASITNTNVGVSKLIFGGVEQLVNTYGGTSSAAVIKNATYFTGAGYLNVTNTFHSWNSASSGLWSDTTKWSTGTVPVSGDAITIAQGQPVLDGDFASSGAIAISSGATLTVNEGIVLTNTGTINNNGDLILKSTVSGTGSLLSGLSVANVTQQRYLSSNQRGWRMLSNPLAATTFNTLATASGITIGNNFTGEYISSSNTFTSTSGAAMMDTQKAYKLFITGLSGESPAYATGPSIVTLVNKGTAANTAPAVITTILEDYYLVANPYTAPVSVSSIIDASTGLSSTVAYYNPTNGATDVKLRAGGYEATTATGAAGSASDVVIPAMGAIFMQASSAGTINIPTSTIFTGTPAQTGTYNHRTAQTKEVPSNVLKIEVRSGAVYYDALALHFKTLGEAGSNIDFGKLPNSILDAYSIAGTKKMAVSEVELATQTIPLGITSTLQKNYTFKVVENGIPAGFEAVLVDKLLNTNTVLTSGTAYSFDIDSTLASQGNDRFEINLKVAGTLSVVDTELDSKIQLWPNPARGQFNILNGQNQKDGSATIEISNLNGQIIHAYKSNPGTTTTIQTKGWAQGVYILKVNNNGNQTTKKLIVQ